MKLLTCMNLRSLPASLLALTMVFAASAAQADSQTAIDSERKKIQSTLEQHAEREIYLKDRIARTEEELQAAGQALEKQEEKLADAISKAESDPSDTTARAATHASIRYNRSEARNERLQERLDSAQDELTSIEEHRAELNRQLGALSQRETQLRAAPPKPAPKPVAPVSKPAPEVAAPAPIAPAPAAAPAQPEVAATWPSPEDESEANLAFAKAKLATAQGKPAGEPPLPNVKLNHNRGRGTESLEYIGDNLYLVNMKLETGMWGFKLFNQTYWVSIPKDKADQDYLIVYDVNGRAALHVIRASQIK